MFDQSGGSAPKRIPRTPEKPRPEPTTLETPKLRPVPRPAHPPPKETVALPKVNLKTAEVAPGSGPAESPRLVKTQAELKPAKSEGGAAGRVGRSGSVRGDSRAALRPTKTESAIRTAARATTAPLAGKKATMATSSPKPTKKAALPAAAPTKKASVSRTGSNSGGARPVRPTRVSATPDLIPARAAAGAAEATGPDVAAGEPRPGKERKGSEGRPGERKVSDGKRKQMEESSSHERKVSGGRADQGDQQVLGQEESVVVTPAASRKDSVPVERKGSEGRQEKTVGAAVVASRKESESAVGGGRSGESGDKAVPAGSAGTNRKSSVVGDRKVSQE